MKKDDFLFFEGNLEDYTLSNPNWITKSGIGMRKIKNVLDRIKEG
jgi:hypothetical protein